MSQYIEGRIAEGQYGNVSEYFRDLVRRDQERRQSAMATEYRLTAEAEDDLQGIADYTFETFGPAQAEAYGLGLRNCFASLVDNPLLGRDYGFLRPGLRRYEREAIPSITN